MIKVGILGGGQLGRMLLQEAANYPVETFVLENDKECPAAHLCHHFVLGDIRDFDAVYNFGQQVDALTIEIESVNVDALEKLEQEGKKIVPKPSTLRTIKNKILQKNFYKENEIPTAPYLVVQNKSEVAAQSSFFPAVNKIGEGGYDGKGVEIIRGDNDVDKAFDAPGILEKMVTILKEVAITVAVNEKGETVIYPPVEMVFDPKLNLLDYQVTPAELAKESFWKAEAFAVKVARSFHSAGLFAVEMFVDKSGEVFVNETAPRVHNSGHHTIEAHCCSQYEMLWRILLNYPLGNTDAIFPSALVNLLGEAGHNGNVHYEGLNEVMKMENVYVHLYGKKQTKPGRKMGHVTVLGSNKQDLIRTAHQVKRTLRILSS